MKYIEMAAKAEQAYYNGIDYLIEYTLPSVWSKTGRGWHEQWLNTSFAGVYASCEGIILLSRIGTEYPRYDEVKSLLTEIYFNHLYFALDETAAIDKDNPHCSLQSKMRDKSLNTTFKLASFLKASAAIGLNKRSINLVQIIKNRLLSTFDDVTGLCPPALSYARPSHLATTEALVSLKPYLEIGNPVFLKGLTYLQSYIDIDRYQFADNNGKNQILLALWAISELLEFCPQELLIKAADLMKLVSLWVYSNNNSQIIVEKFDVPNISGRDYYSVNLKTLAATTLINYINLNLIGLDYINYIVPEVNIIADMILKSRLYSNDGNPSNVQFWDNYQAMNLLYGFFSLIKTSSILEENFMIVKPRLFNQTNFSENEKLVVVIMPFASDWADDLYDLFKDVAEGEGFDVWRADEEYKDDIIIQTIWENINKAKFIIADCTGKNPNVFYELGIAHTIGKPVFMCAQDHNDFPFDISHIRRYQYGILPNKLLKLRNNLKSFIKNL